MTKTPSSDAPTRLQPRSDATLVRQPNDEATRIQTRPASARHPGELVQIGDVLKDRFEIKSLLGHGGMSMVFRALDRRRQEAQDKTPYLAVKVLGSDFLEHPQGFVALQREARKSQTLAHPNIITVYDFDRDGDTVFMTMEQLTGTSLETLIGHNSHGLEKSEALRIIAEIAKGLAYAHSKNIVHSDLKPGNVFVCDDGTVKLLDFGIARAAASLEDAPATSNTVFDAGELGGLTPAYASLEMFQHQAPHPSDDIYALGLIGYELLTGKHPFGRNTAQQVQQQELVPPNIKILKGRQASALKKAIALNRADRLQNASDFNKHFAPRSPFIGIAAALIVVVSILAGTVILQSGDEPGPDVPFESLTVAQQQKINEALEQARDALEFGDLNGALFYYNSAYTLHPRNRRVMRGVDALVDKVIAAAKQQGNRPEATREQIENLLNYECLNGNEKLIAFSTQLAGG